jgi:hypothetical protein
VARIYDLAMTHNLDSDAFFIHRVEQHCVERGLSFFLIEPLWVKPFSIYYELGVIWVRVLLNMHSEHHDPEDVYHRLVRLATDRNSKVIDRLEVALAAFDKAKVQPVLEAAGIKIPPTVIVPRERLANFKLTDADRARLGSPFVIKPSMGYGRRGVVMDAVTENDLSRSIAAWSSPHYLLQQRIVPQLLEGELAYFRVYYVFGSVWACWWNCYTDHSRQVTLEERDRFGLGRLEEIVRQISRLTSMSFFSSEITITEANEFVVIDYVNDQCFLATQSSNPKIGVPDEVVAAIALRLVEGSQELMSR